MKESCTRLLDEIGNYIRRLTVDYRLEICICDFKFPARYHHILTSFGAHVGNFCREIKNRPNGQKRCLTMQKFVRLKCKDDKPFFGTCHAGVSEFIFPIVENDKYYGFISVSGYTLQNNAKNQALAQRFLKSEIPSFSDVTDLLAPLINSFKLLAHYASTENENEITGGQVRVYQEILAFLRERYLQKITLKEIAEELHYSYSYIEHVFRKESGIPLMKYLRNLKIEKAKELLVMTNESVLSISEKVGFEDSNYFTAVFTAKVGVSPRTYRKANT